jgi:DNA modification methylase
VDSIRSFGWTNPILIDGDGMVIAGHGRLEAAKLMGLETVPTIRIEDMTDAEKRAYVIADNRLAENAGWDSELLALELKDLVGLEMDITLTGFEMGEVDVLIQDLEAGDDADTDEEVPPMDLNRPAVSRPGQLWRLGPHRLICGDALDDQTYVRLLNGEKAQMIFADPPYNVRIDGNVCGLGTVKHPDFAMASGEMSEAEYTAFLKDALGNLSRHSIDGSVHFISMDWRHFYELLSAGREVYAELKNLCVWNKSNAGMGSLYRSQHELIAVFKSGKAPHINNVQLGAQGRNRTNVWDYPGINSFGSNRDEELAVHPTVKPLAMVADAILDCSTRGALILDGFLGSGTTILAAERVGRRAAGVELEPRYVDAAIRRFQSATGIDAIDAESGRTFAEYESMVLALEGEDNG